MQTKFRGPLSLLRAQAQNLNNLTQSADFLSSFDFSLKFDVEYVAPSFLKFLLPLFKKSPQFVVIRCNLKSKRHQGIENTFELSVSQFQEIFCQLVKCRALLLSASDCSLQECEICFERQPDILLKCSHAFCAHCVAEIKKKQNSLCPLCRTEMVRRSSAVHDMSLEEMEERVKNRSSFVIVSPDDQDELDLKSEVNQAVDKCYAFLMAKHALFSNYF